MNIREIVINHYGPLRDIRYRLSPGLQVFHGPNESGKTLLMDAILKLMLGNRLRDFTGIDRVPDLPQGRLALLIQGQEHILDGNIRLDQLTGLDSNYLRNVFVIRNKDLNMAGQAGFLRRISDQLTGMEGQRITKLKDILRLQGCLTNNTSSAKLSKSVDFNKIGEHVENAEELSAEIKDYLDSARELQLDNLERRLEDTRNRLNAINIEIRDQEQAEKRQSHQELVKLVTEYEERAEAARRLQPYTQRTLTKLQDLQSRALFNRDTAETNQQKLDQLQPRLEVAITQSAATDAKVAPLMEKKPQLDNLEQRTLLAAGAPSSQLAKAFTKYTIALLFLTALGMFLAAMDTLPSFLIPIPLLSLAAAVVLFFIDRTTHNKNKKSEIQDRRLLNEAAALGIMAKTLQELAAAISQEKTGLEQSSNNLRNLKENVRELKQEEGSLKETIRETTANAEKLEQQLKQELQELNISNLKEFSALLVKYNQAQTQCDELYQRLEEAFGQAPPHTDGWRELLRQLPVPPDCALAFDRDHLDQLRQEKDSVQEAVHQMLDELHRHQSTLANYATACHGLPIPEKDESLPPHIANLEMLEHVTPVLDQFVAAVRTRFTTALDILLILEELEREEQKKMADLVGPDKPVQEIFRTVTGERYTDLSLDDDLNIQVQNCAGLTLPASALSQGTFDQLYLALRLSLAKDLLAGEPGFMLLDDAFLCADSQRLDKLLAVLGKEATQGWQILYLTMDERIVEAASKHTKNPPIALKQLSW